MFKNKVKHALDLNGLPSDEGDYRGSSQRSAPTALRISHKFDSMGLFDKKKPIDTYTKAEIDTKLESLKMQLLGMLGGRPRKQPENVPNPEILHETETAIVYKNGKYIMKKQS